MISTSIIRSTGEKKWMPIEARGIGELRGERCDRQRRGVGAVKNHAGAERAL